MVSGFMVQFGDKIQRELGSIRETVESIWVAIVLAFVLRAFELGADGVLVSGCHFGDCHYIFGNERAVEQFEKTKALLKILGLEEGRIRLEWISAAEGVKFGRVIDEFVEQVRALGPSKLVPRERELPREAEAYADAAALAK